MVSALKIVSVLGLLVAIIPNVNAADPTPDTCAKPSSALQKFLSDAVCSKLGDGELDANSQFASGIYPSTGPNYCYNTLTTVSKSEVKVYREVKGKLKVFTYKIDPLSSANGKIACLSDVKAEGYHSSEPPFGAEWPKPSDLPERNVQVDFSKNPPAILPPSQYAAACVKITANSISDVVKTDPVFKKIKAKYSVNLKAAAASVKDGAEQNAVMRSELKNCGNLYDQMTGDQSGMAKAVDDYNALDPIGKIITDDAGDAKGAVEGR